MIDSILQSELEKADNSFYASESLLEKIGNTEPIREKQDKLAISMLKNILQKQEEILQNPQQ